MYKETVPEDIRLIIVTTALVFAALAVFIIFFIFLFNRRKNKLINEKALMQAQFQQELLQTRIEIQEQTLKTISQEIHDNVGQVLSLAKLNLGTFEDIESEFNKIKISDTKQLVSKAINDLRDLSRSLHGDKIADLGLQEAIANELKILKNTGQYQTELSVQGNSCQLDAQKEMVLFRIVQESISNALKHANARNINVQMLYEADMFKLIISDDGIGFDAATLQSVQTGIGLKSMQNRATLIGGIFSIDSKRDIGTVVIIQLKK